jgi:anti-anti-sigma factor
MVVTDLGIPAANRIISDMLASTEKPKLVLNLSGVNYIDSFSFGWIMRVYSQIREKNGDFAMCCPNSDVMYMLKLTEFSRVVPAYRSEKDAIEAVRTGNHSKRMMYL